MGNELKMVEGRIMKFAFCIFKSKWEAFGIHNLPPSPHPNQNNENEMENLNFINRCSLETYYHKPPELK